MTCAASANGATMRLSSWEYDGKILRRRTRGCPVRPAGVAAWPGSRTTGSVTASSPSISGPHQIRTQPRTTDSPSSGGAYS